MANSAFLLVVVTPSGVISANIRIVDTFYLKNHPESMEEPFTISNTANPGLTNLLHTLHLKSTFEQDKLKQRHRMAGLNSE